MMITHVIWLESFNHPLYGTLWEVRADCLRIWRYYCEQVSGFTLDMPSDKRWFADKERMGLRFAIQNYGNVTMLDFGGQYLPEYEGR